MVIIFDKPIAPNHKYHFVKKVSSGQKLKQEIEDVCQEKLCKYCAAQERIVFPHEKITQNNLLLLLFVYEPYIYHTQLEFTNIDEFF